MEWFSKWKCHNIVFLFLTAELFFVISFWNLFLKINTIVVLVITLL